MSAAPRGTVAVLVAMFALSGAMRLGDGFGVSLARAATGAVEPSADLPVVEPPVCTSPAALAAALSEREAQVLAQEIALDEREAALTMGEALMRGRVEEMKRAEADLKVAVGLAEGAAEADLARLTTVYEAMKPKDAAKLFDAMEPKFAAGFMGRMRADTAASILAGMTSERAYAVSAVLAGRNTNLATE